MGRKFMTENFKKSLGATCVCCGSEEDIEYHHIVPICVGGTDAPTNIVPLCHPCHMALHHGRNITEYLRSEGKFSHGRDPVNDDEFAYSVFDKLAGGLIGTAKCKELMGWKSGTRITCMPQYKKWRNDRGYKAVRNNLDVVAVLSPESLVDGRIIGHIDYVDGRREDISYQYSDENDIVYAFKNKVLHPVPSTLKHIHRNVEYRERPKRQRVDTPVKHTVNKRRAPSNSDRTAAEAWWAAYKKEHYSDIAIG